MQSASIPGTSLTPASSSVFCNNYAFGQMRAGWDIQVMIVWWRHGDWLLGEISPKGRSIGNDPNEGKKGKSEAGSQDLVPRWMKDRHSKRGRSQGFTEHTGFVSSWLRDFILGPVGQRWQGHVLDWCHQDAARGPGATAGCREFKETGWDLEKWDYLTTYSGREREWGWTEVGSKDPPRVRKMSSNCFMEMTAWLDVIKTTEFGKWVNKMTRKIRSKKL